MSTTEPAVDRPGVEPATSDRSAGPQAPAAVIVAVGTDHHPFDRLVEWVDAWAADHPETSVLVQRGTSAETEECRSVELLPHPELCERFAKAVAVVSHGGPSTVMDARMAGRLPIVVARNPANGEHVDDHQMRFAEHLRRHQLARVIDTEDDFQQALDEAMSDPDGFVVPVDASAITGVVEFGRKLDDLLGIDTPLLPASPAGVIDPRRRAEDRGHDRQADRSGERA